jgi:hypothetical protein
MERSSLESANNNLKTATATVHAISSGLSSCALVPLPHQIKQKNLLANLKVDFE